MPRSRPEPRDQSAEHRAHARGKALQSLRVGSRADVVGEEEIACHTDLRALASALGERCRFSPVPRRLAPSAKSSTVFDAALSM